MMHRFGENAREQVNMDDAEVCGFLDVKSGQKYSALKKRARLSSKLWKRLWCSVKRLGPGLGVQVQFDRKFSCDTLKRCESGSCITIPSNAVVHRVRSKSKQFAFAVSSSRSSEKKLLLSLSANSETETQRWMANIRHLLKPRRCSTGKFYVSVVDNAHSKAAGLTGLHGDLTSSETGISIRNIHTGEVLGQFEWTDFSHFHLTTTGRPEDVKRICVMHTTSKFCRGTGELHVFCLDAHNLLQDLVTQGRGKCMQKLMGLDELRVAKQPEIVDPLSRGQPSPSEWISDTMTTRLRTSGCTKTVENVYQSEPNVAFNECNNSSSLAEFNTSVASGIYEEIVENVCPSDPRTIACNVYQNLCKKLHNSQTAPPPLPPRRRQNSKRMKKSRKILNIGKKHPQSIEIHKAQETELDNSSYVPMSPQMRNINGFESNAAGTLEEESYVLMR